MALLETPKFNPQQYRYLEIDKPCFGGINLNDLEFKQGINQSPDVLNMMYRNGGFSKRYGQKYHYRFEEKIHQVATFHDDFIMHIGNKMYKNETPFKDKDDNDIVVPDVKGIFIPFNKMLYYLIPPTENTSGAYYVYDHKDFKEVEPYIPDVLINRTPDPDASESYTDNFYADGTEKEFFLTKTKTENGNIEVKVGGTVTTDYTFSKEGNKIELTTAPRINTEIVVTYDGYKNHSLGDTIDDFNRLGTAFNISFHGDGKTSIYKLYTGKNNDFLPYDDKSPIVKVLTSTGEEEYVSGTDYTFNKDTGVVTFTKIPPEGTNNVIITAYKTQQEYIDSILKNKFSITYGGANNSRLFLAGGGESMYYFSDVYDATYFPESNYASLGHTEEDIVGFGEQYDTLIVFKPKETYALDYYQENDSDGYLKGNFTSKLVNPRIGCDCPDSIQLINNLLVWVNTEYGVCTLVSTAIEDERNIRVLSYNIDGGHRKAGILQEENLKDCKTVDYDSKYFLTVNGKVYMWDYLIAPYWSSYLSSQNGQGNQEAMRLSWFMFDNFNVDQYIKKNNKLYYIKGNDLVVLTDDFNDFGEPINAHYMTPFLQFNAVDYLKTVKDIYVQCRGDTSSVINMYYYTEESLTPEQEPESIRIGGRIWQHFAWDNFQWLSVNYAKSFRRKCSLKKIEMCAFYFVNNEKDRDMSISHIGMNYLIVKNVK